MNQIQLTAQNQAKVVQQASEILAQGGLVLYPTETVYGAAVDATNQAAVNKLLQYKSRREGKPLSIAVTDSAMAREFVEINDQATKLYQQFLPGPMTVISKVKQTSGLAIGVASEFGTLGIRISSYPLVSALVKRFGKPITATSANASGKRRPYSIDQILNSLSAKQRSLIDLIIDAGTLPTRPPSTVIDTTLSTPVIFRQGTLLETAATSTKLSSNSEAETKQIAGKLFLKHWDHLQHGPVIFGLNGPLGAGKTIFAKGLAAFLGISAVLVSPTYTYIEEYPFQRQTTEGTFFHIDAWKVDSEEQFQLLQFENLLRPNAVIALEWYSQVAPWVTKQLVKHRHQLITVALEDTNEQRKLTINEL